MSFSNNFRHKILPLREQLPIQNAWLQERLNTVLPEIMQREGLDMWLVIAREYNEDPLIMTLLPLPAMSARRRTILVFSLGDDGKLERLTLSRYPMVGFYEAGWDPAKEDQYGCLARIIAEKNPKKIGINVSKTFAFADGLSHQEYNNLVEALGRQWMSKVVSAERVSIGWLESRTNSELTVYPSLVELGHALIAEAFSSRVITPGITTTDDVVWWMRQQMLDAGLEAWFHPSVDIQSVGQEFGFLKENERNLILPGDLLHCDVGFYYLGLATDQQQHAYVLRSGEVEAPEGIRNALAVGNRLQDILINEMQVGLTGNEVLKATLDRAKEEEIQAMVYSHPLGYHGHGAGPTIGLWDQQGGVPSKGEYELFDHTVYSIELNITCELPEWNNQEICIMLEEDAVLLNGEIHWLDGRQTSLHLISSGG